MKRPPALDQARWQRCNNGDCVEVTMLADRVWVRGSQDASGAVLSFTIDEWTAFLDGVRRGHFDLERLAPQV
ncbi:DUF397 domain-containing protein [Nonomuraea spiralis]|uniref:DUF397 domain-containing protein n=1 Tax=Nonomuraea spiralis TaxID=46182 RepID=A0ABV5IJU5_9ACTN|nr:MULTISPECIES: DUF397 domain-containing protein [Nonomuraea]RSN14246.1 DUF397 domain-containing protein [Nonomuraea sp. WAC 01424]GGS96014.1 hypothetical protein GCM10010176_044860 [Nonomuraea spiralis]